MSTRQYVKKMPEQRYAIQVAYSIESAEERETKSLLEFKKKNDAVDRLIVVTYEEEKMIEKEGTAIEVIPAYKLMLG